MAAKPPSTAEISPDGVITPSTTEASAVQPRASEPAQIPSEPAQTTPAASADEPEFSLDAFELAKHSSEKAKPAEVKKTESEVEVEEKLTPAAADAKSKTPAKVATSQKLPTTPRDLSDVADEDKPLFERMSNDAFNKFKPIYKAHKELSAKAEADAKALAEKEALITQLKTGLVPVPESYYENENAFVLTPEFTQAADAVNLAESVRNHWANQLSAIAAGEKTYIGLVKDAQGNIRPTMPIPVDANTERQLQNNLAYTTEQVGQRKAALDSVATSFKAKAKEASGWLTNWEKGVFPIFEKPEGKESMEQAKDLISKFPPAYRNNPLVNALAKSLVLNNKFVQIIQASQAKTATSTTPQAKAAKTTRAPSLEEVHGDGGAAGNNDAEVTMDDFNKLKNGL